MAKTDVAGVSAGKKYCGLVVACLISLTCALPARAMTYVPMSDDDLLASSPVVVSGHIIDVGAVSGHELDQSEYRLAIDEVLKGSVSGEISIRLPGAFNMGQAGALIVPGMPRFSIDDTVLLFLEPRGDGSYSLSQFALGRFSYTQSGTGEGLWERDLSGVDVLNGEPDPHNRLHRNAERFSGWVRERVAGRNGDNGYWSFATGFFKPKYALTSPLGRWVQFERGQTVPVYAGSVPLSGLSGGGYPDLQTAINAWNNDSGSNIRLAYAGTSTAAGGLAVADGITEVIFNDPNSEISGIFDCLRGGIGALGQWRGSGTQVYKGQSYRIISEGDIVVQDGISCLLDDRRSNNAPEILAHELGHVLGLGHSCGDGLLAVCESGTVANDALMRPTLHADGRGATLSSDDRAAIAYLYDPSAATGTTSGSGSPEITPDEALAAAQGSSGGGAVPRAGLLMLMLLAVLRIRPRLR